jgi:hypothetical protein
VLQCGTGVLHPLRPLLHPVNARIKKLVFLDYPIEALCSDADWRTLMSRSRSVPFSTLQTLSVSRHHFNSSPGADSEATSAMLQALLFLFPHVKALQMTHMFLHPTQFVWPDMPALTVHVCQVCSPPHISDIKLNETATQTDALDIRRWAGKVVNSTVRCKECERRRAPESDEDLLFDLFN